MKKFILVVLLFAFNLSVFAQDTWDNTISDKEKLESELKLYPNPCKNSKITVDFQSKEITEIRLTNITGKQVLKKKYDFPTHKTQLQLHDIPNGVYLIQVKTSDNKTLVKKLLVSTN